MFPGDLTPPTPRSLSTSRHLRDFSGFLLSATDEGARCGNRSRGTPISPESLDRFRNRVVACPVAELIRDLNIGPEGPFHVPAEDRRHGRPGRHPGGQPERGQERPVRAAHANLRGRLELPRHDGGDRPRSRPFRGRSPRDPRHPGGEQPPSGVRGRAGHARHPPPGAAPVRRPGRRRQEPPAEPPDHDAAGRDGPARRARPQHAGRGEDPGHRGRHGDPLRDPGGAGGGHRRDPPPGPRRAAPGRRGGRPAAAHRPELRRADRGGGRAGSKRSCRTGSRSRGGAWRS
jgi:hypothetical protein